MLGAVRGGMALSLRADADEQSRALWRGMGFTLRGGGGLRPVALADAGPRSAEAAAIIRTRSGIGSCDLNIDDPYMPEVSRIAGALGAAMSYRSCRMRRGCTLLRGDSSARVGLLFSRL